MESADFLARDQKKKAQAALPGLPAQRQVQTGAPKSKLLFAAFGL
jgi:hypothetical protein